MIQTEKVIYAPVVAEESLSTRVEHGSATNASTNGEWKATQNTPANTHNQTINNDTTQQTHVHQLVERT